MNDQSQSRQDIIFAFFKAVRTRTIYGFRHVILSCFCSENILYNFLGALNFRASAKQVLFDLLKTFARLSIMLMTLIAK